MSFETREDVRDKIEWEGGIVQALEYGLKAEDMPEGDTELRIAWAALQAAYGSVDSIAAQVDALLPDYDE